MKEGKLPEMNKEFRALLIIIGVFVAFYVIPFEHEKVGEAVLEAFYLTQEYAREHVLFCLIPAFFIAGAIGVFISQTTVIKYFGAQAKKALAYGVASVSGSILAVCSCTVLPLFAGIYSRGAGIGPATTFLYSGPAINVLAIVLTARVLGWQFGVARAVGAVFFSVIIGVLMSVIFAKEERNRLQSAEQFVIPQEEEGARKLWQNGLYFFSLVGVLVFAAWAKPVETTGLWYTIWKLHWYFAVFFLILVGALLALWFRKEEMKDWGSVTWGFSKQILPLLFAGVMVAGFLMGTPDSGKGLIPAKYIGTLVGGNSLWSNLVASIVGAFMYFATLTEVPILQGLLGAGMGKGPALALLLAGPALSLPNMLVIRSVMGNKKTLVFVVLVIVMATITGLLFGAFFK